MPDLKTIVKRSIAALPAPLAIKVFDVVYSARSKRVREFLRKQRRLYERLGRPQHIAAGPFQGMRYLTRAMSSCLMPKFVGTYEHELHNVIERICAEEPDLLVDIGSAEGYYAVGLARRLPALRVICFEIYKPARYLLHRLAKLNDVSDRITQHTWCTPTNLQHALEDARQPVVICDCEGAEDHLLLPDQTPALAKATVLVELHDGLCPGVSQRLRERFETTHHIAFIPESNRTPNSVPPVFNLSSEEAAEMMDEDRYGQMSWFLMTPRNR